MINANQSAHLRFTGKELDNDLDLGLYYFGARYYDAEVGRFIGVDPLAGKYPGWTPYNYTLNNPLRLVDPDGREVRIYSRPVVNLPIIGEHRHLFIVVKNSNTLTSRGLFPKTLINGAITYSKYITGKTIPVIKKDLPEEKGAVQKLEEG